MISQSERLLHSINAPQTGVAVNPNPFFALTRDQRVHPQQQQQRVPTSSYLAAAPDTEPQCRSGSPAGATAASASESNSSQQQHYLGSLQKLIGKQRLAIETANSCLHVSEENNSRLEAKVEELQAELESLRVQQLREEERRRNGEKEELLEPGGKLSDEQVIQAHLSLLV